MNNKIIWTHPPDRTEFDKDLYVIGCGYDEINEKLKARHRSAIHKIEYHILYFIEGGCTATLNGSNHTAKAGDVVFFHTDDKYTYTYTDNVKVYWIHFSGEKAVSFMDELEMRESFIKKADTDLSGYFDNIINEISLKKRHYNKAMQGHLMVLMTAIVRKKMMNSSRLDEVLSRMNNIRKKELDLDEYAKMCHLSKSQFIRVFKEYTGKTPIRYKNDVLIDKAKERLTHSDKSISEISSFLGFENIYYFSAMFKKSTGMSPAEYRKTHK